MGNLLLIAALIGRVPIAPEVACAATRGPAPREPLTQEAGSRTGLAADGAARTESIDFGGRRLASLPPG